MASARKRLRELRLDVAGAGLEAVLIVDAAPVADHVVLVEQEDFRRADRAELVGHDVVVVLQHRERSARTTWA